MPCYECAYWRKPIGPSPGGWCQHDGRIAHANYHCKSWTRRKITHAEVGLTQAEVRWARANPTVPHVRRLAQVFRSIEERPDDDLLRTAFADLLEGWRAERARQGISLSGAP